QRTRGSPDIISKSVLLHPGSPSIYQLGPKKETFGTLTKLTDEVCFQIVDEGKRSQTKSQTSDVIVYQVFGFEGKTLPYSLTIIDTPGFGDTRRIEHDILVTQGLLDLFRSADGVHEVNAVGLVMKSSENRLSDRLWYIFDSVMSLFGKGIEKNIVALITHSNGTNPENVLQALEAAEIKCARDEKNQEQRKTKTGPQKMNTTVEVLNERVRLTACIQNLQERIGFIEEKQTEIKQTEEALKKHEEEMKKNKNFTVEVDETYKDKKPIKGGMWGLVFYDGAVTCKVCEENCHYPGCTTAPSPQRCEILKDGRCTSCTRKCPVEDHVKEEKIYVTKTRRVKKTLEDMKKKYEDNLAEREKKSSLLENLKTEMNQLEADKTRWLEEAYQHVVNLEKIALKAHSISTYVHLDFLIEKMKEKGDAEKVQEL
uniref:AIG1-type G domain-containing protein n=1 Tax=Amphiprion percula TaxID=161767 RepID=A0A3P8U4M4_AMPPE